MRERARDARPDVVLPLDVIRPDDAKEEWFNPSSERSATSPRAPSLTSSASTPSRSRTTGSDAVRADRTTGADPLLRFLALVEALPASAAQAAAKRRPKHAGAATEAIKRAAIAKTRILRRPRRTARSPAVGTDAAHAPDEKAANEVRARPTAS